MSTEAASNARRHLAEAAKIAYAATNGPQQPLSHLETIATLRWRLDQAEKQLVEAARDERKNWGQIGRALGMTRQSARERFGTRTAKPADPNQLQLWPFAPTGASPHAKP